MAIISKENLRSIPLISVEVCWRCEYLQVEKGKYSSHGPYCGECEQRLETYRVVG